MTWKKKTNEIAKTIRIYLQTTKYVCRSIELCTVSFLFCWLCVASYYIVKIRRECVMGNRNNINFDNNVGGNSGGGDDDYVISSGNTTLLLGQLKERKGQRDSEKKNGFLHFRSLFVLVIWRFFVVHALQTINISVSSIISGMKWT